MSKVLSREETARQVADWKREGKRVGFTSGVFDLLHPGHVSYLEKAREACDRLVVGVNSDSSVRELKGPDRPLRPEMERARVVAGLRSVDAVFLFSEKNNGENVELLKPDLYVKAGDYSIDKLSSAKIVESYGGKVVFVPFEQGHSSTGILESVLERFMGERTISIPKAPYEKQPAVFLDRDGTINEHVHYLHEPEKFKLIPGAIEAMRKFQDAGYRIVIVTNQPGIGLGYFTKEDFFAVNKLLFRAATAAGVRIDRIYFSPYSKADQTDCRKPATGLIDRAVKDLNIDLPKSWVIGDMTSDVQLAKNAGCHSVLVKTGEGGKDGLHEVKPDHVVKDLAEAAKVILKS